MSNIKKTVDLTKLAPRTSVCEISIGNVELTRLSVGDIAAVMIKFPAISSMLNGGGINLSELASAAPEAIPYIIALGTKGKEEALDGVKSLSAEDQLKLIEAVFNNSFENGIASFFEVLASAARAITGKRS